MNTLIRSIATFLLLGCTSAWAADHLDSPLVQNDPAADINDVYVFVNPNDPDELMLVATVLPIADASSRFSDAVEYRFNVVNLATNDSILIGCRALGRKAKGMRCQLDGTDTVAGPLDRINTNDAGDMRLFAGVRDDPFFFDLVAFNQTVANALAGDPSPIAFDPTTAEDFFAPLNTLAIVIGVDSGLLTDGGVNPLLGVWASTHRSDGGPLQGSATEGARNASQVDRMGRPAVNTALINLTGADVVTKDQYNTAADPATWVPSFADEIELNLAVLDSLDGATDNAFLYEAPFSLDYETLAGVLAFDVLLIDTSEPACADYLAVEAELVLGVDLPVCGGRTLMADVIDVTLSGTVVTGASDFVDDADNVYLDDFPFVSGPQ